MQNYYSTIDDIVLTFSSIYETNYLEQIQLHYERPNGKGFDIAELTLPTYNFTKIMGFSEDEAFELENYARDNAPLIWEIAREIKNKRRWSNANIKYVLWNYRKDAKEQSG